MKKTGLFTALGLIVAAGTLRYWIDGGEGVGRNPLPAAVNKLGAKAQRKSAPSFELERADGSQLKLSSLKGQPVIVHFWAKWCPPCVHELPEFLAMMRRLKDQPVQAIAISLDPNWEDAHQVLKEKDLPPSVTLLIDPKSAVSDAFGSFQFPETYLLDRDLNIVEKWVGPQDWAGEGIRKAIESVVAEKP